MEPVSAPEEATEPERAPMGGSFSVRWTRMIDKIRTPLMLVLHWITSLCARHPRRTVSLVSLLSIALVAIGLFTNFSVDVNEDTLWTPDNGKAVSHSAWIDATYDDKSEFVFVLVHANGENVVNESARVMEAWTVLEGTPAYQEFCEGTCPVYGFPEFWNASQAIHDASDDPIADMSQLTFPDGTFVSVDSIFGYPERDANERLTTVLSYSFQLKVPANEEGREVQKQAIDRLLEVDDRWVELYGNTVRVEAIGDRSFSDEFTRAIVKDIPLVPIVFIIMSIFTCAIFFKRDKVRSRSLLGFAAVLSVLLSILTGYGMAFIIGIPFTSMTQLLPFVIFGIGLDDAFIMSGAFERTDPNKDPVERIQDTIEDVGLSVTVTTLTSTLAFTLGTISSIPAIYWLCQYAAPTIAIVFVYQLTFFVACIVLDERRVMQNRRDCCTWITVSVEDEETDVPETPVEHGPSRVQLFMRSYANILLKPVSKILSLAFFLGLLVGSALSVTNLTQEFKFTDVLPADSYLTDFQNARDAYRTRGVIAPYVYFRFVDQSLPEIQEQMLVYVDELANMSTVAGLPELFWLRDFQSFVNETDGLVDVDFPEQIAQFLADPVYQDTYADDILLDDQGSILTSRVAIYMDSVDVEDVREQMDALDEEVAVTSRQPVNRGQDQWSFFSYDGVYNIWEFYAVSVDELIFTTIVGVACVSVVALLFIPHWTATLFVLPMICILYVDVLGVMQWAGLHINAVSYISLVMSIGLMVDFIMHVLLRFYESSGSRREKTVEMLETMGSSILIGGVSTFLGTLPLAFSTSEIFKTIFFTFLGLVTLGVGHGLILLPVILSTIGPEDEIRSSLTKSVSKVEAREEEEES